ncbi:hypothetical protein [Streptomyces sp. NBC_00503]|uniref:hypothetical protein n=1 Tax=Streptomyces sp. NBC_00503 TaxID=2903659 RepID=UPI002E80A242|nr:hypothetical protein [Streptomyces sp. NBC_00503]WUD84111.1 hypothetical protein OG490_28140 [Streptomyces sp. NBC_00503]
MDLIATDVARTLDDTFLATSRSRRESHERAERLDRHMGMDADSTEGTYRHPNAPVPLRPVLLTQQAAGAMVAATRRLVRLIAEVGERRAPDFPTLVERLGYRRPPCSVLTHRDSWNRWAFSMARPDIVVSGGRPWFVECNLDSAIAGIEHLAAIDGFYWKEPTFAPLARRTGLTSMDNFGPRREVVLRAARSRSRSKPSVAILGHRRGPGFGGEEYFDDVITDFARHGLPCRFAVPDELEHDARGLTFQGSPIDVALRMFTIVNAHEDPVDVTAMREAVRHDTTLILAPEAGGVYTSKKMLAWLSEDADLLTARDGAFVRRTVPWTRELTDGAVSWQGERTPLLDLVLKERERFVLKPADQFGARGVVAGRDATESEWHSAVSEGVAEGNHVVQEFHAPDPLPQLVRLPGAEESAVIRTAAVFSPLVMGGKGAGILVRQSPDFSTAIVNTPRGGVMNTAFVCP